MAISEEEAIRRRKANLSWNDIKRENPTWSEVQVQDYLDKQQDIDTLSDASLTLQEQVNQNTQTNADQQLEIDSNTLGVINNALGIAQNETDISNNTTLINGHINDISDAHDATAISYDGTTSGYTANNVQAAIDEGAANLDTHEALTTAHGVTGDNVGTEDYAQALIGGAVLLAALVNDAIDSTVSVDSPDATAAPATYDQAQAQTVVTLANELKGDVNQLVTDLNAVITQLNDFIDKSKTAKQMSTT